MGHQIVKVEALGIRGCAGIGVAPVAQQVDIIARSVQRADQGVGGCKVQGAGAQLRAHGQEDGGAVYTRAGRASPEWEIPAVGRLQPGLLELGGCSGREEALTNAWTLSCPGGTKNGTSDQS